MNWYKRARLELDIIEAAKRQNPGPEHQRLESILRKVAAEGGFTESFDLPSVVGTISFRRPVQR